MGVECWMEVKEANKEQGSGNLCDEGFKKKEEEKLWDKMSTSYVCENYHRLLLMSFKHRRQWIMFTPQEMRKWNSLTWWKRGTAFVYHLYREMMLLLCLVIKRLFQINRPLILVDVEILGWVFRVCLNGVRYLCIYACVYIINVGNAKIIKEMKMDFH